MRAASISTRPSQSAALPKAQLAGKDLFAYDPHSRAAGQYVELAEWLLARVASVREPVESAASEDEVASG